MEQQIHFCTTHDRVRIAYATVGAGPPLVKAANWLSHLEFDWRSPVWRHLLAEFARDHTFIRYDERGNGLSDWKVADLSFDAWVEDLESVVEAAGVDRFPLLGISQGGAVAIAYAVRHPEKVSHLILYGAYARGWAKRESAEEIEQRQAQLTLVRLGWGKDNPAFRQLWTTLYAPDATPEQAQSFNDLQRVSTSPENAVALLNVMGNIDVVDLLPQVRVPTLVLHCRDEAGVPFEEGRLIASSIPDARFVPLEGRNHLLLEGDPSWGFFVKEVRRFLGTEETSAMKTASSGSGRQARPDLKRSDLPERYTIISFLGVGGMGEVYLAEDTKLGRKVALKTLPAEFTNDRERLRRFQMEARAASALNHPNLLTIHEIGAESGAHFIAAEYIDGETLRTRLKKGRMKIDNALDVAQQTAFALTAAHGAGILHRDIKPENIMVRHDGIVKVLDFGLAKLLEDHAREMIDHEADTRALVLTDPGRVLGTPAYMSPEQARGMDLDARTDIWSLGVVLYEMVAGRPPFRGETKSHTVVSILESEPPPLATFAPEAPAELQRIVRKALTKDRDSRYQTARDLMIDLKSLRRDLDIQSEMQRSVAPNVRVPSAEVTNQEVSVVAAGLSDQATSLAEPRATSSDSRSPDGSIRYRVGAMLAMLILAIGTMSMWYYWRRQNAAVPISSIAVMPFVNASGNNDVEYLSDGITESLINNLARLPSLRVIARNTAFTFKGRQINPQQIGKQLGVRALLTGQVVQLGDTLSIQVDLVDADSGTEIWGDKYNRTRTDILLLQDEIARQITDRLRLAINDEAKKVVAKRYTNSAEAYEYYLKGRYHYYKGTEADWRQALESFNQAIARDPDYALAYAGVADCYGISSGWLIPPNEAYPKLEAAALSALRIDNTLADATAALASAKLFYDHDWVGGERDLKRALELDPESNSARVYYSFYLYAQGRTDESLKVLKEGLQSDPLSLPLNTNLGETFYFARRYDEALAVARKTLEIDRDSIFVWLLSGWSHQQKGDYQAAIADFQKARQVEDNPWAVTMLGNVYGVSGQKDEAQKMLAELEALSNRRYVSPYFFALIYTGLGDKDRAFNQLNKAFNEHNDYLIYLKVEPLFDSLRSDPRFADLIQRLGI